jgi:hypothetical protein
MQIGRNAPCPCGSGKKYKKCCMSKDEEARRQAAKEIPQELVPPPPVPLPSPPSDLEAQDGDELWEAFKEADYEEKISLFEQTLEERELMDGGMAFNMLNEIYPEALEREERSRFDGLIGVLRESLPEVFAGDACYYLSWQLANVLATGQSKRVPEIMRELAPLGGDNIDTFNNVLDRLAYHGKLSVMVKSLRTAWPKVEESSDIVPWGIEEFSRRGFDCACFEYLEENPAVTAATPELLEQCEFFCENNPEGFESFLAHLTGRERRNWSMDDLKFENRRPSRRDFDGDEDEGEEPERDPGRQNLFYLTVEFLGYLRREEEISYARGEIGRTGLNEYLLERYAGDLTPQEDSSPADPFRGIERRRRKKRRKLPRPEQLLHPDKATLDRYLARLLNFINPQHYKVAATFELVPAWLRFLELRGLLDAEGKAGILQDLTKLADQVIDLLGKYREDPTLRLGVKRAWEQVR